MTDTAPPTQSHTTENSPTAHTHLPAHDDLTRFDGFVRTLRPTGDTFDSYDAWTVYRRCRPDKQPLPDDSRLSGVSEKLTRLHTEVEWTMDRAVEWTKEVERGWISPDEASSEIDAFLAAYKRQSRFKDYSLKKQEAFTQDVQAIKDMWAKYPPDESFKDEFRAGVERLILNLRRSSIALLATGSVEEFPIHWLTHSGR